MATRPAPAHARRPDHRDADLVLKLYALRREPVMRASRAAMAAFLPRSEADVLAATRRDHPVNAALRQTTTYWEMAYGMVKHGILHGDFMLESSGEGLLLFAKLRPYLPAYREAVSPRALENAEWIATHVAAGRKLLATFDRRVAGLLAAS